MGKDESNFITGIFNYCDRWCERCTFTERCRVGVTHREFSDDPASSDLNNAAFWDHLKSSLQGAKDLLIRMAEERGIDLEAAMAEEAARPKRKAPPIGRENKDVLRAARAYPKMVDKWFEGGEETFRSKGLELATMARLELPGATPVEEANDLHDAVEVVRWYCYQIYVKLQRASHRDPEELEDPDYAEVARQDADGSAKVAIIGMDRSIAAWGRLYQLLPDAGDTIVNMLVHLDRLRRATERVFPNARAFQRPGFDTPA